MSSTEELKKISIFSELTNRELKSVAKLMTELEVKEGRNLTKQGEVGREFMIIKTGSAAVRRNDRKIATLGPGDVLGELAVLSGAPPHGDRRG